VLELRSGSGFDSTPVASSIPKARFSRVELLAPRLPRSAAPGLLTRPPKQRKLPNAAGGFDAAFSVNGFPDAASLAAMLRDISRVLRPGGRLVTVDQFPHCPLACTLDDLLIRALHNDLHAIAIEDLSYWALGYAERCVRGYYAVTFSKELTP
jgi:SAM-dependent methyltransferase